MNQTKVSVIIPVYNTEKYLEDCIKSVTKQTLEEIEIICINDGSTDKSLEILERLSNFDERIKILNRENRGSARARNEGILTAKGNYITFVDSDDKIEKTFLEKTYESANSNNADICCCGYYVYYQNKNKKKYANPKYRLDVLRKYPQPFDYKTLGEDVFKINLEICSKLFKRDFLIKNNILYPERKIAEDVLFFCKSVLNAKRITAVFEQLYLYRKNNTTNISDRATDFIPQIFESLNEVEEYMNSFKDFELVKYSYYGAKLDILTYWLFKIKENTREQFFETAKKTLAPLKNLEGSKLHNAKLFESYLNDNFKTFQRKFAPGVGAFLRRFF